MDMELAYFTCKHNPLSDGDEHPDTQMWQAGKYLLVEGKSSIIYFHTESFPGWIAKV